MKTIILVLTTAIVAMFVNCNPKADSYKEPQTVKADSCIPYFTFDKIDHYFINISEEKAQNPDSIENETEDQKRRLDLVTNFIPVETLDTTLYQNLEQLGFILTKVPRIKFEKINEIFCERKHDLSYAMACGAVFRDILIFKDKNKTVGVAKICFTCDMHIIVGTKCNTQDFGQSGDFEKLKRLLHE